MTIRNRTIWVMGDAMNRDAMIVRPLSPQIDEYALDLAGGTYCPRKPVEYRQYMRSKLKDLIATGFPGRYILSDRIISVLRLGRFKGWNTYPVSIVDKKGLKILGYYGFSVSGRCGPPDESRCLSRTENADGLGYEATGLFFDEETWDGSDIFMVQTTAYICVTGEVRDAVMSVGARNIRFRHSEEIVRPIVPE